MFAILKRLRPDFAIASISAIATLVLASGAIFAAHSPAIRILFVAASLVVFGTSLYSWFRVNERLMREEERGEQARGIIKYLMKPEHERTFEDLAVHRAALNVADALFTENFDCEGASFDTTINCRLCGFQTTGPLALVRGEGLTHLRTAHPNDI